MSNSINSSNHKLNRRFKLPIIKAVTIILLHILVVNTIALAILPVALLPISTTVPASIQVLFAMAEAAHLVSD
jgi:type IV secretory pathway component VirB8